VKQTKQLKEIGARFIAGFSKHDLMTLSAALAFYTALSLSPLMLLLISAVSLVGGAESKFIQQVQYLMGSQATEAIKTVIDNAQDRPNLGSFAGIFGVLTLLFSASGIFSQLQSSLNVIWEAEEKTEGAGWKTFLRKRVFSMGMVLALAFIAVVSLVVSTGLSAVMPTDEGIWRAVNLIASLAVFSYLFALIFKYLPDVKISWRHVLFGGFVTALMFTAGKYLIGLYLGKSALGSTYGAAGSLIVLLAWVYYSSLILFVGAEFTCATFKEEKSPSRSPAAAKEKENEEALHNPALGAST
jgi:membrane protein